MPTHPLRAISVGYAVERSASAPVTLHVHSRFRRALNLRAPHGGLLTLLGDDGGDFPTAVRIALPAHWDWRREASSGMPVVLGCGGLWAETWHVDLRDAVCWQPHALDAALDPAALWRLSEMHERAACRLREHAGAHAFYGHQLALLPPWPAGGRVVAIGPHDDPCALAREVGALIGYGAGLTPEGDDYLLGYLAALWPWRGDPAVGVHRQAVAAAVQHRLHATTDISRHYLQLAVRGQFSAALVALLQTLAGRTTDDALLRRVDAVLQFGASSGADTLAGVLHGIRTLRVLGREACTTRFDEVRPLDAIQQP